jgi:two-component system, chemotaxis family, sensor histidine kinase and response regulator PixL
MDNENRISLKFLDEAEDCCDRIESTVLGLANTIPNPQELDEALRAAHSIKGSAAMMGFAPLSHVAHQLEDFLKILRVRYHSKSINTEVETLLLQGVDCLRQVGDLHRQGRLIDEAWLATQSQPIFDRLRQQLGDLRPEDEDALLYQEGDVDPALLLFESGVKEVLDVLDGALAKLSPTQLLQELQMTAEELSDFGRMAQLERFVELCQSVKSQIQSVNPDRAVELTHKALKAWRKSHSLVLLERFEQIPDRLTDISICSTSTPSNTPDRLELLADLEENRFNLDLTGIEGLTLDLDLSRLQSEIANLDLHSEGEFNSGLDQAYPPAELLSEFAALEIAELPAIEVNDEQQPQSADFLLDHQPLTELLGELAALEIAELPAIEVNDEQQPQSTDFLLDHQPLTELLDELAALEIAELPAIQVNDERLAATVVPEVAKIPTVAPPSNPISSNSQTVRIPIEYLRQFNTTFGQLILERNAIDLRLTEIQNYTSLMSKRMKHLESSNQELRQWSDQAATAGLIPAPEDAQSSAPSQPNSPRSIAGISSSQGFDLLEMDRYNDLQLVSQDQIETIVQLQEVTADIELSLQEMTKSVRSLNQTTQSLQGNLTRTQMMPFADVVKRFPRTIRDLSVQFGKPVTLKIVGEHTGIDRAILENLSDPLIHLLRNAFDHGIEDPDTRLAAGKSAQGTIVLAASQRSGETVITISDDGGGIKFDRIRDRLQQMGLSANEVAKMPEAELLDTIFEPGFSTATSLTELSGRGVGMDVVRTNIEQIRGTIRVQTQPGLGTSFTIRVPFTLSIVRVMLLERAGFIFAVSVDSIKEMICFQPDLPTADGTKIAWQSQEIPLVALERGIFFGRTRRSFELPGTPTISHPTLLIVGDDQSSTAFHIDRFWGELEVTFRSIDSPMPLTPGFGNSIILGDGHVVPLVDLIQFADWILATPSTTLTLNPVETVAGIAALESNRLTTRLPEQTQPNTVLVIDDSINVRRYLAVILEQDGYQVEQARDGQEAVEKLLAGLVVQAAICDIEMPRLDGYGVLAALRSDQAFENLPIVMLTSRSSEKHRTLAMNLGASAYFSKPYTPPELLATLRSLIQTVANNDRISSIR